MGPSAGLRRGEGDLTGVALDAMRSTTASGCALALSDTGTTRAGAGAAAAGATGNGGSVLSCNWISSIGASAGTAS
jgi:hypothetical protein